MQSQNSFKSHPIPSRSDILVPINYSQAHRNVISAIRRKDESALLRNLWILHDLRTKELRRIFQQNPTSLNLKSYHLIDKTFASPRGLFVPLMRAYEAWGRTEILRNILDNLFDYISKSRDVDESMCMSFFLAIGRLGQTDLMLSILDSDQIQFKSRDAFIADFFTAFVTYLLDGDDISTNTDAIPDSGLRSLPRFLPYPLHTMVDQSVFLRRYLILYRPLTSIWHGSSPISTFRISTESNRIGNWIHTLCTSSQRCIRSGFGWRSLGRIPIQFSSCWGRWRGIRSD
eukprot:TRINITY_DN8706_c0_g1_i1.p1 TRINITY_DN8706_c0_g1~~TRINITY_DN8706_c0_g1_i1.p1  ORF type:complete len:321 (-),score=27.81 TRINITY_DN8706_c0_g1_i1:9-869(-)